MKGYKGFDKNLKCRDKQYTIGKEESENEAVICSKGLHFCELPHDVFRYYNAGNGNRFCEVEAEDVSDEIDDDSKRVAKRLFVKAEISAFDICKIAVSVFFKKFGFKDKIASSETTNAGYCGAANAGNYGAANAGYCGAASVKKNGVAVASTGGRVKGDIGSILILVNRGNDGSIIDYAVGQVDGKNIMPDTWYCLDKGNFKSLEENP